VCSRRKGICILDELYHLVSLELCIVLDNILLNEPLFELRVGPGGVDGVVEVIVILAHFVQEILAGVRFGRSRFDKFVAHKPFVLMSEIEIEEGKKR
jgi:hypothetical protein